MAEELTVNNALIFNTGTKSKLPLMPILSGSINVI